MLGESLANEAAAAFVGIGAASAAKAAARLANALRNFFMEDSFFCKIISKQQKGQLNLLNLTDLVMCLVNPGSYASLKNASSQLKLLTQLNLAF